jgi:hypothetical protein
MSTGDALRDLQAFLDSRWAVAQPRFYSRTAEGPRVPPEVTATEAGYFLASVATQGAEPPLFSVDDDRQLRSDRHPPRADGAPRGFFFFEEPGRVRLETIVQMGAMPRLQNDFGWPREHMIFESPDLLKDGRVVLGFGALDILLLEAPCKELAAKMTITAARSHVGVEAKANVKLLGKLVDEMRACQTASVPRVHSQHKKCLAIAELRPRLFLGVAAAETWRLFTVVEREGRAVLGDELPDLDDLHFSAE